MNSLTAAIEKIIVRDLNKLEAEIRLYPDEPTLWMVERQIANSAGNLCLHLCGNLRFYIGHTLGHITYERNREAEFSLKNVPREELLEQIQSARMAVAQTLPQLTEAMLDSRFPIDVFKEPMSTRFFLVHLAGHLSYHLGQINYHRRLLASR